MTFDIHIQIVNYNTKEYLKYCIDGIISDLTDSNLTFKISVLDNDSSDDLSDLELKYKEFGVTFYRSESNLGFGKGHNFLSKKEKSRYLLLVNPDIKFVEKNTILTMFRFITTNSKIKVAGPKMITDNMVEKIVDHGELHGIKAWVTYNLGGVYCKERSVETDCAWTCGAFFLVERALFESVGGFDENYFLFVEEEDLCLRIRKNKGKVYYYPNVKVLHHSSVVAKKSEHYYKSHSYYIKKNFEKRFVYRFLKNIRAVYWLLIK